MKTGGIHLQYTQGAAGDSQEHTRRRIHGNAHVIGRPSLRVCAAVLDAQLQRQELCVRSAQLRGLWASLRAASKAEGRQRYGVLPAPCGCPRVRAGDQPHGAALRLLNRSPRGCLVRRASPNKPAFVSRPQGGNSASDDEGSEERRGFAVKREGALPLSFAVPPFPRPLTALALAVSPPSRC